MDCHEIFEALSEYIDKDLANAKCAEIDVHLEHCHNCRVVVDTLRKTVSLYHSIPDADMPDEVRLRLHRIIRLEETEGEEKA